MFENGVVVATIQTIPQCYYCCIVSWRPIVAVHIVLNATFFSTEVDAQIRPEDHQKKKKTSANYLLMFNEIIINAQKTM